MDQGLVHHGLKAWSMADRVQVAHVRTLVRMAHEALGVRRAKRGRGRGLFLRQVLDAGLQRVHRHQNDAAGLIGGLVGPLRASKTLPHSTEAVEGQKIVAWISVMTAMAATAMVMLWVTRIG